jgi:hypothetical protein
VLLRQSPVTEVLCVLLRQSPVTEVLCVLLRQSPVTEVLCVLLRQSPVTELLCVLLRQSPVTELLCVLLRQSPVTEVLCVLLRQSPVTEVPLWRWNQTLSLRPPAFLPPHFKTYVTVESYCWCLVCFPHSWAGRSQVTMEITQMAPVHPNFPLQESRFS